MLAESYIPKMEVGGNIMILLVVTSAFTFRYLIARMRHKEVITAIEKGISPSELKAASLGSPRWVTNITFGIFLLFIAPVIILSSLPFWDEWKPSLFFDFGPTGTLPVIILFLGLVLFGIGISSLIRGILQRKFELSKTINQEQISKKTE